MKRMWGWIAAGAGVLWLLAATGRKERQRDLLAALRRHFPPIARMRLVGACPELDDVLSDSTLEPVFDSMLRQMYDRSGTAEFAALVDWAARQQRTEIEALTGDVARAAVELLPHRALAIIDGCNGRDYAGAVFALALTEAGERARPEMQH